MIWHILFVIVCRSVSYRVCIYAKHREVACLSWPHPVICFTTIFSHRLRHSKHQSHIPEVSICSSKILVTLIERFDFESQCRVCCAHLLRHHVFKRVKKSVLLRWHHIINAEAVEKSRYIFLFNHETHEEVFVWQFVLIVLGIKTIEHIIMLYCRMASDGLKPTVVVSKE